MDIATPLAAPYVPLVPTRRTMSPLFATITFASWAWPLVEVMHWLAALMVPEPQSARPALLPDWPKIRFEPLARSLGKVRLNMSELPPTMSFWPWLAKIVLLPRPPST